MLRPRAHPSRMDVECHAGLGRRRGRRRPGGAGGGAGRHASRSPPPWRCCATTSRWTSTRTPGPTASRRDRASPATRSRGACAPAASPCSASPTFPTRPSSAATRRTWPAATRVPEPGLLWNYHLDRLAWVDELVAKHGIRRALTLADVKAAHAAGQPAIILDVEGLDFLEKKLERLEESYARGVRTMQLVHYTPNDLGDFQTGAVVHHGLTPFGADVIRACNKLGVVVDVAHATSRHREAGGQGRHPAAAALAHRAARLEGARRHAAHRAPGHCPTTRAPSRTRAARSASGTSSRASSSMSMG